MSEIPPIPTVQEVRNEDDFMQIVAQAQSIISKLKFLNYDALYDELAQLNIRTSENPHLQQLNVDLQAVQMAKDRASEISTDIMRHAQTYRRIADLLTEGWVKFSDASGADKRKGEAALKMSQFEHYAVEAETLQKAANAVLKNLDSKHEASSRQITCFSLQLKLGDVGRTIGDSGFLAGDFTDYGHGKINQPNQPVVPALPSFPVPQPPPIVVPPSPSIGPVIVPPKTTDPLPICPTATCVQVAPAPQTSLSIPIQTDATTSTVSPLKTPDVWDAFSKG